MHSIKKRQTSVNACGKPKKPFNGYEVNIKITLKNSFKFTIYTKYVSRGVFIIVELH